MPSRCTLGCGAGSLLDRLDRPVLPEYSYNAIRKCKQKVDLMCLIGSTGVSSGRVGCAVDGEIRSYFVDLSPGFFDGAG